MKQNHYNACLDRLARQSNDIAEATHVLRTAASERGQAVSLLRVKALAETLASELADLQNTEAEHNVRGFSPPALQVLHA